MEKKNWLQFFSVSRFTVNKKAQKVLMLINESDAMPTAQSLSRPSRCDFNALVEGADLETPRWRDDRRAQRVVDERAYRHWPVSVLE